MTAAIAKILGALHPGRDANAMNDWLDRAIERVLRAVSRAPVRLALGLLVVPRLLGAVVYSLVEADANWFDGVWWAGVTQTTVGYGDFSPESFAGRVTAEVIWWSGIMGVALLTGALAGVIAERRLEERKLAAGAHTPELDDDFDHLIARTEADAAYLAEQLKRLKLLTSDPRVKAALRERFREDPAP